MMSLTVLLADVGFTARVVTGDLVVVNGVGLAVLMTGVALTALVAVYTLHPASLFQQAATNTENCC